MTSATIAAASCIIRNTAAHKGRTRTVAPGSTSARHLHYGRIILDRGDPPIRFTTGVLETGLICLRGSAVIRVDGTPFRLARLDALYAPRDAALEVLSGDDGCDIVEVAAPVAGRHPVQFVPFANVQQDPTLHMETGVPGARRELNVLIGKNVEAGRLMAGVTFSAPGNWTSWPPHEHAEMLEEAYLYIEMPPPGFGVQLVYTDPREPELVTIVREGDVVLMPAGYHPNVAAPGSQINFVWMMAANRENVDRRYGVVNVEPAFSGTGSGLEAARSEK